MSYYIVSKDAARRLIDKMDSRQAARDRAKEVGGTVKTEAEWQALKHNAETFDTVAEAANEQRVADQQQADDDPSSGPSVDNVATVVEHAAQVANSAAKVAAEAAALLAPPTGKGASIMAMAHAIKAARPARKTIGAREKAEPKRPPTDDGILAAAREHLLAIARPESKMSKVQIVRDMALWGDKKLQRKDVFQLIKAYPNDLGIADATISTQFQFARSGRERQHG